MATEVIHFVDPNSSAGGTGHSNALSGTDRAFVSLNAAEAALQADIVTADEFHRIICSSDDAGSTHAVDSSTVTINGWTTDATRYIQIESASPHLGVWDDTIYRFYFNGGAGTGIIVSESYTKIVGLQVGIHSYDAGIIYDTSGLSTSVMVKGCLLKGVTSTLGVGIALYGPTPYIINNILYDCSGGINCAYTNTSYVYNNTLVDCRNGITGHSSAACVAKNNLVKGGTNQYVSSFNAASCNNASSGGTAPGTNSRTSQTFTFVNEGANDFHLASNDAGAKGYGVTDPGSGLFLDDIDGQTRSAPWDIGADQYVAADLADVDVTDAVVRSMSYSRTVGEAMGVSDSIFYDLISGGTTFTLYLAESLGVTDEQVRLVAKMYYLSESIGISDSLFRLMSAVRTIADNMGISDSETFKLTIIRSVIEAVGITDARSSGMLLSRSVTDSVGLSDALTRLTAISIVIAESMGITDAQLRKIDAVRIAYELAGVTDSSPREMTFMRSVIDNLGIVDAAAKFSTIPRVIAESLGLTDAIYSQIIANAWVRTVADSVGVSDFLSRTVLRVRQIAESCGVTDARVIQNAIVRVLSEALGIVDATYQRGDYRRYPAEIIGVTDAKTAGLAYIRSLAEQVGVTDAISTTTMLVILRAIAETLGTTDARGFTKGAGRYVYDSVGITDARSKLIAAVRTVADNFGITDFDFKFKAMTRSLPEDVGITDDPAKLLAYIRYIADTYDIDDSALAGITMFRTIFEQIGVSDYDTGRILTALYLTILLGVYDEFIKTSTKSKRITLTSKDSRITLEVE